MALAYIHPKANIDMATQAKTNTVQQLQRIAPDTPILVMGDFHHCKPGKSLCNFYQYVSRQTCQSNCLNLCFGTNPFAELCLDHFVVYLVPSHKSVLNRKKRKWRLFSGLDGGVCSMPPGLLLSRRFGCFKKCLCGLKWIDRDCVCVYLLLWGDYRPQESNFHLLKY